MKNWDDVMNEIHEDMESNYMPARINNYVEVGRDGIAKNVMLYLPDVMWELYFENLIGNDEDDKYEIYYMDGEWKEYSSLLYDYKNGEEPGKSFPETVGMLKAGRNKVDLLGFIHRDKFDINENSAVFPDHAFIPLYILYLQNRDFFSLFTHGKKDAIKYGKDIVKYGNELTKYDAYHVMRYAYEKLTGVNLALLFANYFIDMTKCLQSKVLNSSTDKIGEDKEKLKNELLKLLKDIIRLPMIFGRIIWADIILQTLYIMEKVYISPYGIYNGRDFFSIIEIIRDELEFNGMMDRAARSIEIKNNGFVKDMPKEGDTRFTRAIERYEEYKDTYRQIEMAHPKKIEFYNQWGTFYSDIKYIISKKTEDAIAGYEDIGNYVKQKVKNNPNQQMPVIFIKDDIMRGEECMKDANKFLTYALLQSTE